MSSHPKRSAPIKTNFFSKIPGRKIGFFSFILIILSITPAAGGKIFFSRLSKNLEFKIKGQFVPVPFFSSFYLRNAHIEWKNKVELRKGDLLVSYDFVSFLLRRPVRVRLSGRNLDVRFLGGWAKSQGVSEVTLAHFFSDLEFDTAGIHEIYCVDAESPKFQFHIKSSEHIMSTPSRQP